MSVPNDGSYATITTGPNHYCAKRAANNQISCGGLSYGDYPLPSFSLPLAHMVSGAKFSCGLRPSTGAVVCWGEGADAIWYQEEERPAFLADNCLRVPNPDQADDDEDDTGNACEEPSCQEGLFFSRYVTASQAASSLNGSPGGALAIYNPTDATIDLANYSVSDGTATLNLEELDAVGGGSTQLASRTSYVICRNHDTTIVGGNADETCDFTLRPGILAGGGAFQDFETLFTGNRVILESGENIVDVIGPSPNTVSVAEGVWLEDPADDTQSQLNYLRRKSTVTQGSDSFQSEEWEQAQFEGMNIELTQIGFNGTYDGCSP